MTGNLNFDLGSIKGLTSAEVQERLARDGFNVLPSAKRLGIMRTAIEIVREPMFLLLLACGALYLFSGDTQEAIMLLGFVFVVMGITFFQARKTERALEALRDLSSPRALVIRDGHKQRIAGRDVVRGDIILLSEGDRVPADAVVINCVNLFVDESLLTGESIAVRKISAQSETNMTAPGGDDSPSVFSGTLVVRGHGIIESKATGMFTEIGKIGKALQTVDSENTPLQRETGRLVRTFAIVGLVLCVAVVVTYGLTRGNWLAGFLAGLSLAMAMLPEEFPVVLTIFLAIGAWRISRVGVLTRRIPAVETLGSATVLCVDKTGTLTMNRMSVRELYAEGQVHDFKAAPHVIPEIFHEVVEFGILASPADPFDPMEKAMREFGQQTLANTEHIHNDWTFMREYPLTNELFAMTRVWRSPDRREYVVAAKGAPEAIANLCHFPDERLAKLEPIINDMSSRGLRVIGVAKTEFRAEGLPPGQHDFEFVFVGLLGLEDPVRPKVKEAVGECYHAGIRTIMITGDYPGTAQNIARQIGLRNPEDFITGAELAQMSDADLSARLKSVNLFARMVPEQKLRLVKALKEQGEVVAMTGDGVNDAPALKSAHIGIAMGGRGTDVAREAAAIVLIEDDFDSIVHAVRMGRRIFDNLKKAMMFIFSVHVPIAGFTLIPVILEWPLALFPVHIVFLELIIDPACSVVFEAEPAEGDIMSRPPRKIDEPLFGKKAIILSLLQGLIVLAGVIAVYAWAMAGHNEDSARALAFITLVISNLGLILSNRTQTKSILKTIFVPNPTTWWVVGSTILFLNLALFVPFLTTLFRFGPLHLPDFMLCVSAAVFCVALLELLKMSSVRSFLRLSL
ncbi:MAG: cation-translocating P-type ATPase [Candidatus Zixiibacteriota bacterium]